MTRQGRLQLAAGMLLLVSAAGSVFLARGTADAARAFREQQPEWQRGLAPTPASRRGGRSVRARRCSGSARGATCCGPTGLSRWPGGCDPGNDVPADPSAVRGDQEARTTSGITRKATEKGQAVDVVLGVILTDAAANAGPQRKPVQRESALAAFVRAIREDRTNAAAKLDLEVLLQAAAPPDEESASPVAADRPQASQQRELPAIRPTCLAQKETGF